MMAIVDDDVPGLGNPKLMSGRNTALDDIIKHGIIIGFIKPVAFHLDAEDLQ